eukprot:364598-Chlamydomonas_euryale.AAC.1
MRASACCEPHVRIKAEVWVKRCAHQGEVWLRNVHVGRGKRAWWVWHVRVTCQVEAGSGRPASGTPVALYATFVGKHTQRLRLGICVGPRAHVWASVWDQGHTCGHMCGTKGTRVGICVGPRAYVYCGRAHSMSWVGVRGSQLGVRGDEQARQVWGCIWAGCKEAAGKSRCGSSPPLLPFALLLVPSFSPPHLAASIHTSYSCSCAAAASWCRNIAAPATPLSGPSHRALSKSGSASVLSKSGSGSTAAADRMLGTARPPSQRPPATLPDAFAASAGATAPAAALSGRVQGAFAAQCGGPHVDRPSEGGRNGEEPGSPPSSANRVAVSADVGVRARARKAKGGGKPDGDGGWKTVSYGPKRAPDASKSS